MVLVHRHQTWQGGYEHCLYDYICTASLFANQNRCHGTRSRAPLFIKEKKKTKKLFIWLYEHFNRLIIVCTGSHAYSSNKSMLCHTKSLEVFFSKLSPNDLPNSLSSYFSAMGLALCVGDLGAPRCDDSGMKIATNNASMTNIAPNAKGGPGIIVWNEKLNIL